MIKSPCKSCKKHKKEFPNCFSTCNTLQTIQLINIEKYHDCKTNADYNVAEDYSINLFNYIKNY